MIRFFSLVRGKGREALGTEDPSLRSEMGQSMTEYIFLVILVALVLAPFYRLLPEAIRGYVRPFYYCVSRPIP